ncbi:hypothetical protein [Streptomyces sp. NPDC003688]
MSRAETPASRRTAPTITTDTPARLDRLPWSRRRCTSRRRR